jgi:hypothetical protein
MSVTKKKNKFDPLRGQGKAAHEEISKKGQNEKTHFTSIHVYLKI